MSWWSRGLELLAPVVRARRLPAGVPDHGAASTPRALPGPRGGTGWAVGGRWARLHREAVRRSLPPPPTPPCRTLTCVRVRREGSRPRRRRRGDVPARFAARARLAGGSWRHEARPAPA